MSVPEALSNLCRLCMSSEGDMKDIFSGDSSFSMKISLLACIEVQKADQLPKLLCETCEYQLEKFYIFRKRCKQADGKYRSFLRKIRSNKISFLEELSDDEDHEPDDTNLVFVQQFEKNIVDWKVEEQVQAFRAKEEETRAVLIDENRQNLAIQRKLLLSKIKQAVGGTIDKFDSPKEEDEPHQDGDYNPPEIVQEEMYNCGEPDIQFALMPNQRPVVERSIPRKKYTRKAKEPSTVENYHIVGCLEGEGREEEIETTGNIILRDGLIYDCSNCDRKFHTPDEMKKHMANHSGPKKNVCEVCQKVFCSKGVLARHMKIHSEQKEWTCEDCGKSFIQKGSLMRHSLVHNDVKPFACNECGKSFSQRHMLTKHENTDHSDTPVTYRYRCKECDKTFNYSSGLSRHALRHTGKKFQCHICEKVLSDSSALNRHIRMKHKKPEEEDGEAKEEESEEQDDEFS